MFVHIQAQKLSFMHRNLIKQCAHLCIENLSHWHTPGLEILKHTIACLLSNACLRNLHQFPKGFISLEGNGKTPQWLQTELDQAHTEIHIHALCFLCWPFTNHCWWHLVVKGALRSQMHLVKMRYPFIPSHFNAIMLNSYCPGFFIWRFYVKQTLHDNWRE